MPSSVAVFQRSNMADEEYDSMSDTDEGALSDGEVRPAIGFVVTNARQLQRRFIEGKLRGVKRKRIVEEESTPRPSINKVVYQSPYCLLTCR